MTTADADAEASLAALSLSGSRGRGGWDDTTNAAPSPEAGVLPAVRSRVRCEGLTGAAELNGDLGRVVGHDGERARVLMDGGRVVGVKPRNLVVVCELLDRLLAIPGFFAREVLARLGATDCALLAQVGRPWMAAVLSNNLWSRAGKGGAVPLNLKNFVRSVKLLAWAKANKCPWEAETCKWIAW
jgi:hypothetical protein